MAQGFNPDLVDSSIEKIDGSSVSDLWLRYLDAVASAGSFTAAATSMGVGQSTVSHAIGRLESALGCSLFRRNERGVELTAVGDRLWVHVRPAMAMLDDAIREARSAGRDDAVVALSVSTSFAAWWLLPRLGGFKAQHPHIELRCITSANDDRVGLDDSDMWIPHGANRWPRLEAHHLTDERIRAVAAPAVAQQLGDVDRPAALLVADLIHLEERYGSRYDWSRWFEHHGLAVPSARGPRSNDYSVVVQAAIDGQGVALGWEHITGPLIDDGRLVAIGGPAIRTNEPFVILQRPGAQRPAVDALRCWLVENTP